MKYLITIQVKHNNYRVKYVTKTYPYWTKENNEIYIVIEQLNNFKKYFDINEFFIKSIEILD